MPSKYADTVFGPTLPKSAPDAPEVDDETDDEPTGDDGAADKEDFRTLKSAYQKGDAVTYFETLRRALNR